MQINPNNNFPLFFDQIYLINFLNLVIQLIDILILNIYFQNPKVLNFQLIYIDLGNYQSNPKGNKPKEYFFIYDKI